MTNSDSYHECYKPNDPECLLCGKPVEPQHTPFRDTVTSRIVHDYCFRIESAAHFAQRRRDAGLSGAVYGSPRWA